ncbi:MAG: energy-coupling factor ABC transporter permease [Methanomassiliicoccales archaeon]|nr:energy-coupling factor ABC transporter permease [Methanomassiliicoccales archaeon]
MEGYLPLVWCIFWWLAALPFVIYGAWKVKQLSQKHPEQKLTMALAGAFIFVFSALKIPSVTGSSSHPTGTGLSSILYGPGVTALLSFIVLIFQALLIAHGGFTTLGANVFSMGVAGPFIAYFAFRALQKARVSMAASVFSAAFLADFVTYVVTSFQLALAFPSNGSVLASFYAFFVIFAITQVPLALAEAVLMVIFFDFLARTRPDTLKGKVRNIKGSTNYKGLYVLGAAFVLGVIGMAYVLNPSSGFVGTDDQGSQAIEDITGGFERWTDTLWSPTEAQVYALLAFQAAIGMVLVFYFLRRTKKPGERKRARPQKGCDVSIGDMAYCSPAYNWPPLGKLALAIALLIASLASSTILVPLLVLGIGASLLFYSTRFKFPRAIALALLDAMVIILISTVILAFVTQGSGEPLFTLDLGFMQLSLYPEGVELAALVFVRALAGVTVMLFFATSTPIPHFARALRSLHIPSYLAELVVLVYRYSFLLLEQLDVMYTAAQCRIGFRGTKNKFRTSGKLAVGLFIRSLEVAERSQNALSCRNFHGDFPSFRPPAKMTVAWALLPVFVIGSLLGLNFLIVNGLALGG